MWSTRFSRWLNWSTMISVGWDGISISAGRRCPPDRLPQAGSAQLPVAWRGEVLPWAWAWSSLGCMTFIFGPVFTVIMGAPWVLHVPPRDGFPSWIGKSAAASTSGSKRAWRPFGGTWKLLANRAWFEHLGSTGRMRSELCAGLLTNCSKTPSRSWL